MSCAKRSPYVMDMKAGDYYFCTCGESEKQPFCDGAHSRKNTGKTPLKTTVGADQKVAWCGCKQSGKGAFCDGTHSKLG